MPATTRFAGTNRHRNAFRSGTPAGGHRQATGPWRRGRAVAFVSDSTASGRLCEKAALSRNAMSASELTRFDELVSRYLDDALSDNDAAELAALLAEPPLAARFVEMTRLNSEIAGLLAAPVPDAAMVELVRTDIERILAGEPAAGGVHLRVLEKVQAPPRRTPVLRVLALAALFFIFAGLLAVFLITRTPYADAATAASVEGDVEVVGRTGKRVLTPGQS